MSSRLGPVLLRDAFAADFAQIVALNDASVHFTSPMDLARVTQLHEHAAYHRVLTSEGVVLAFLLAFREGAPYDSVNYQWFAREYRHFLYIDRIVVSQAARGANLGTRLYEDIFAFAAAAGVTRVTCEYDLDPPNPVSERFHQRHGFREVGRQWLGGGKKQVSLQLRDANLLGSGNAPTPV
jgi:predicted GNAT superfamily acetyltransferase